MKTRQVEAVKAHKTKIKALLAQEQGAEFYAEITSDRMQMISRHLNLLNRKILTEGPSLIPEDIFRRIERVPDLLAG